jgi:hypothetical protein
MFAKRTLHFARNPKAVFHVEHLNGRFKHLFEFPLSCKMQCSFPEHTCLVDIKIRKTIFLFDGPPAPL